MDPERLLTGEWIIAACRAFNPRAHVLDWDWFYIQYGGFMVVSSLVVFGEMILLIGFLRIIKQVTRLVPSSFNVFDRNMWYNQNKD